MLSVCVGAGAGARFGGDKLAAKLGRRVVLERSLDALRSALPEAELVAVVAEDRLDFWRTRLLDGFPDLRLVPGGRRRQDSVRAGVEVAARAGAEVVVVHDGARPLVDISDIRAVYHGLGEAEGAILTAVVSDTVKRIDVEHRVMTTLPRDDLRFALTPQVFRVAALVDAWRLADDDREWTDESALLESLGMTVNSVDARHPNPKLTTASDLQLACVLLGRNP